MRSPTCHFCEAAARRRASEMESVEVRLTGDYAKALMYLAGTQTATEAINLLIKFYISDNCGGGGPDAPKLSVLEYVALEDGES